MTEPIRAGLIERCIRTEKALDSERLARAKAEARARELEVLLAKIDAKCEEWLHDDTHDEFKFAYTIKLIASDRGEPIDGPSARRATAPKEGE